MTPKQIDEDSVEAQISEEEEKKRAKDQIGDEKGVAFILDDASESTHIIKIRPRLSWHGGTEPTLLEPE